MCTHICVGVYIYTRTHACMGAHTHVCIHVSAYIQLILSHISISVSTDIKSDTFT